MAVSVGNPEKRERIIQTYGHTAYDEKDPVDTETVYDLASLTKPLATTLGILSFLKEGSIQLTTRVSDIFPQTKNTFLHRISIKDLLCHSAGFVAHQPYYLQLSGLAEDARTEKLLDMLAAESPAYTLGSKSVYSDLGFMLLGLIIEKTSNMDLPGFFKKKIVGPLGLEKTIFYAAPNKEGRGETKKRRYASTEQCPFRKKQLCGEVSDENAYALGGAAGHAGLFGTIEGVLEMGVHLLDQWQGREEHPSYHTRDLQRFLIRQDIPGSTWALGFDTPSLTGSSGGRYLAPTSVGHLGFTGTSFWIDPTRDLVMVLLSNRVHPSRENSRIKQFRPLFHDTVMESLGLV